MAAEAATAFNVGDWRRAAHLMELSAPAWKRLNHLGQAAACLGGGAVFYAIAGDTETARACATEGLALARSLGVPSLIARNLAALASALADGDPDQARALLREAVEVFRTLGFQNVNDVTQAVLVGAQVRDWEIVLECAPYSVAHLHWLGQRPVLAGVLTIAGRAIVETDPDATAVLQGISRRLAIGAGTDRTSGPPIADNAPHTRELVGHLRHETTAHLDTVLGADRRLELRAAGEAMGTDDAVAYVLSHLDKSIASTVD
jgi:hypothetical protein